MHLPTSEINNSKVFVTHINKGHKQASKKISNEIKTIGMSKIYYWPSMCANKEVTQNGKTIDKVIDHASLHQWLSSTQKL